MDSMRNHGLLICRQTPIRAVGLLILVALFAVPLVAQQRDYDLERRIEAAKEEIRTLMSKGRYEEVIQRADALLLIDRTNASAIVWKDQAQRLLAAPVEQHSILGDDAPKIAEAPTPTPRPIERPTYTPVPLSDREKSSGGGLGLPVGLLIGLAVGALLFVALAVVAVMRVGSSRKRRREMEAEGVAAGAFVSALAPSGNDPETMHDAVTHVSGHARAPQADEDSVMQYGSVGRRDPETLSDQDTLSDAVTRPGVPTPMPEEEEEMPALNFPPPPPAPAPKPAAAPPAVVQRPAPVAATPPPVSKPVKAAPAPDPASDPIALDFRMPPPETGADAPEEMTFGSLMFAGAEETKAPAAAAKQDDALSFNSLMFGGDGETKPPAADAEDPNAMSFTSLMFKGADETQMPGAPPARKDDGEDPNAMSYASMMFGGDETVAPGTKPPQKKPAADPLDLLGETVQLSGGVSADDNTLELPPPNSPGGSDLENTIRFAEDDK